MHADLHFKCPTSWICWSKILPKEVFAVRFREVPALWRVNVPGNMLPTTGTSYLGPP